MSIPGLHGWLHRAAHEACCAVAGYGSLLPTQDCVTVNLTKRLLTVVIVDSEDWLLFKASIRIVGKDVPLARRAATILHEMIHAEAARPHMAWIHMGCDDEEDEHAGFMTIAPTHSTSATLH